MQERTENPPFGHLEETKAHLKAFVEERLNRDIKYIVGVLLIFLVPLFLLIIGQKDLMERVVSLSGDVKALSVKIDSMDKRLGVVENRLDSMDKRLGVVENRLDSMDKRLSALERK